MRRTFVAGLIGLVYGICTGVIFAAYHEFGSPSLLKPPRFVAVDPAPAQLLPREGIPDERTAATEPAGLETSTSVVADTAPLTSPADSAPLSPTAVEIRRALVPSPAGEPVSEIVSAAAAGGSDSTQDAAQPGPSGDEPILEEASMARAPDLAWQRSVAAAPEMASELDAAVQPQPAPAVLQKPLPPATAVAPPRPAFRPLDALTTVMAEAGPPATLGAPETPRGALTRSRPPKPSFKPVMVTEARPEPARGPSTRAVAATAQTLPEALRAFWTNLKILLASAPASSDWRAGRGGNGGYEASASNSRSGIGSPGGSSPGGGGGGSSPGDSGGNSSANAGGGGASAGGGSGAGGGGGASDSGGDSSASSGGDRSGGDRSSVSSGGDRGRDRGDRDRGSRGGRDRDDDRSSRGDDRGGRGDGGRGGRGNGRGGGDDD